MTWLLLPLRIMYVSMVLKQQGSVSTSVAHGATKGHVDVDAQGYAELILPPFLAALRRVAPPFAWERGYCTLLGQHSREGSGSIG